MSDGCEELRLDLERIKHLRTQAAMENADARSNGRAALYTDADNTALWRTVEIAARRARLAGCDVSDMVGDDVGVA